MGDYQDYIAIANLFWYVRMDIDRVAITEKTKEFLINVRFLHFSTSPDKYGNVYAPYSVRLKIEGCS